MKFAAVLFLAVAVSAKVYFSENFDDGDAWESRWVASDWKEAEQRGALVATNGKHGDGANQGVQTAEDARFYTYSAKHESFGNTDGKTVVLQFTAKHEQNLQCGGAYIKFHPSGVDQAHYHGGADEDAYNVMFGPDWCGSGHKRIHAIFNYNGKNNLLEKLTARAASDNMSHRYALVINGKNIKILLDDEVVQEADLSDPEDFAILPPKMINDPAISKPNDWVDEPEIDDPEDIKPEGYDEIQPTVADPDAAQPDDWDNELDGDWEAPQIANPEYRGEWRPKRIPNPDYIGVWEHPQIENPDYSVPNDLGQYADFGVVGIEIWQVQAGTVFDNILITDSEDEANEAWKNLQPFIAAEKKSYDDEAAAKAAAEAAAAEAAAAEEADEDDDEEDDKDEL